MTDSHAAEILCKVGFACPIVANMSTSGTFSRYGGGPSENEWSVTGPWGSGGATLVVYGNSRCSDTSGTYLEIGTPAAGGGIYCWCQIKNGSLLSDWTFHSDLGSNCHWGCGGDCSGSFRYDSSHRSAVCVPPTSQSNTCDSTTVIANNTCSVGYIPCVGSKTSSNTAGSYTITCS
jgi:hypothetical protein